MACSRQPAQGLHSCPRHEGLTSLLPPPTIPRHLWLAWQPAPSCQSPLSSLTGTRGVLWEKAFSSFCVQWISSRYYIANQRTASVALIRLSDSAHHIFKPHQTDPWLWSQLRRNLTRALENTAGRTSAAEPGWFVARLKADTAVQLIERDVKSQYSNSCN